MCGEHEPGPSVDAAKLDGLAVELSGYGIELKLLWTAESESPSSSWLIFGGDSIEATPP